ncbi:pilus assembly protein TadG-related protein [Janibacter sp. G349]|uniref:pilus assembly protein TadG-related protein n=1 Tax=unclassified Janibacter TaxID=2649294 RepID=UPI003B7F3658
MSALRSGIRRLRDERGSLSTYFVSAVFAVVPLVGLVVDGGGQVRAMQQANDLADETARFAGQQIETGCAIKGAEVVVYLPRARQAAQRFIDASPSGASLQEVTVGSDGHTVNVRTSLTYEPIFLGMIGVGPREVEGTGSAYQYRTNEQGKEYDADEGSYGTCGGW